MELIIEGGLLQKELVEPLLKEAGELVAIMVDDFVKKVENLLKTSFRRKPESSKFNYFWMPDQVRHDGFGTFYEIVMVASRKSARSESTNRKSKI